MHRHRIFASVLLIAILATPTAALAQDGLTADVSVSQACGVVTFALLAGGGMPPYSLHWDFGDGEVQDDSGLPTLPLSTDHTYTFAGQYTWALELTDASDPALQANVGGALAVGPQLSLTSDVFPPLLTLEAGQATLSLTATVSGGEPPYMYAWDLDGYGVFEPGADTATVTYSAGGKYVASVQVTDNCGLTAIASLTVVVVDPAAETCHPMAQRIADGVNALFPSQATQLYTCEDIFAIFRGALTGQTLGFGQMWHAVQLAATLQDMTWEEILQWKLDGTGWGTLVQLDRFAKTLGDIGPGELVDMMINGEASLSEIRTAIRMTTHYGADFLEALDRAHAGSNPGELGQFYRAASELDLDPAALDDYLRQGMSLAELRHAARVAEQTGAGLELTAQAHHDGLSWGEINQAARLAAQGGDLSAILEAGVQETRPLGQQERQQEREGAHPQQLEQNARTAARLSDRYGIAIEQVQAVYDGTCAGSWACVQATLQTQYGRGGQGGGKR